MTPTLSLFLVHDYFFAKGGIATSSNHPLRLAIERHKARLQAEFTKARLRKRCASVEQLKARLLSEKPLSDRLQPRWIRINTLKSSLEHELATTFKEYLVDSTIDKVASAPATAKVLAVDQHIPDLVAVPPEANFTRTRAYIDGAIILQDKASCFPAYLLTGDQIESDVVGDCIDACAAPGNKTTHLSALSHTAHKLVVNVYACEKDERRSKTLISMTKKAGTQNVIVLERQDFLALDPQDPRFANVTHLLLDPSCSGSGILGREDIPTLTLPVDPKSRKLNGDVGSKGSKKRKRDQETSIHSNDAAETSLEETKDTTYDPARLQRLATLQSKIVQHAFAFPAAIRVTYSTCSVHVEENEAVVTTVLESPVAKSRGWSVLRRQDQVPGLRDWVHRGVGTATDANSLPLSDEIREACIRCYPGDEQGTMGFFLCGFVRPPVEPQHNGAPDTGSSQDDDRWEGFSD